MLAAAPRPPEAIERSPTAAASERIRQLVESAARAWGRDGVRINCVTLPVEDWGLVPSEAHAVPNRYGPSLAGANETADAAGAIALLLHEAASGVTGATVGADRRNGAGSREWGAGRGRPC